MGFVNTVTRWGKTTHVALYRRFGGRKFNTVKGLPVALLIVKGRKTGLPRTTPMAYFDHDGSWLVVGSAGGMKPEPQWFRNLRRADQATLEIGETAHDVSVRVAEGDDRERLWAFVTDTAPFFEKYQQKAAGHRVIPIAVLTPR